MESINAGYNLWANTYRISVGLHLPENTKALPSEGDRGRYECEMRGPPDCYYYVRMLELYGPFPLITRLIPRTPIEELKIPRTPFDET